MTETEASDAATSDAALMAAVRAGTVAAFGELYQRHAGAARRLAGALVRDPADAEDLVAETFEKVLATLRNGRGPEIAFRAYLLTTLRHVCYDRARRDKRLELTDDITRYETGTPFVDTTVDDLERSYAARAFAKLPERWRMVLWHTEVEGETPAQIAPLLGLTPNGVAALAYRARERLRQMYLQEHVTVTGDATCLQTADRLSGYVRDGLGPRERSKVDSHLKECETCRLLYVELAEVNSGLRGVLAPLVLGGAASAYLAATSPAPAGGLLAVLGAAWAAVLGWGKAAWGWPVRVVRRLVERFGRGKVAAGAGVAGAIAAALAVLLFVLMSKPVPDEQAAGLPPPPPQANPAQPVRPTNPVQPPAASPTPAEPTRSEPAASKRPPAPPRPAVPAALEITPDLVGGRLVTASAGALPVTVRAPRSARATRSLQRTERAAEQLELVATLPSGVRLRGADAGDGWRCTATPHGASCHRAALATGTSTTARIPVTVARGVTGFQPVTIATAAGVRHSRASFRVPVAPAGTTVGYAAKGRVRMALTGSTLLSCPTRPACLSGSDNHQVSMVPYLPGPGEPIPPRGALGAVSGAKLDLPSRGRIRWAGLYWAASGHKVPDVVAVHGPGGGWHSVVPRTIRGTYGERSMRQAYADVTNLVRTGGSWWLTAPVKKLPGGTGAYAGWSLVVAYEDRAAPTGELAVYAGPAPLRGATPLAVQAGPRGSRVQVGLAVWDGDRNLTGDCLRLDSTPLGDPHNVAHGVAPGMRNTLGVDIAAYAGTGSSVTIKAGNDPMDLGVLAVAASAGPASTGPARNAGSAPSR